jgi:hypothetical protein
LSPTKIGRALLVHGGDLMIVSPGSMIAVPKDAGGVTSVLQRFGEIELEVSRKSKPHFIVKTPFLAAIVKGTHFKVRVLKRSASVIVQRGRVEVDDLLTGEKVDVLAGQTAVVKPGQHLSVTGTGTLSPILKGKVQKGSDNPFSSGGGAGGGISASRGGGASGGGGGIGANVGGLAGVSAGSGGISASVGGGKVASVNAGSGGVGVSALGGGIGASVGGGGVSVNVGGISLGGGGRHR